MYYTKHSGTNVIGRLRYDTSEKISRDLEQIWELLTNNLNN